MCPLIIRRLYRLQSAQRSHPLVLHAVIMAAFTTQSAHQSNISVATYTCPAVEYQRVNDVRGVKIRTVKLRYKVFQRAIKNVVNYVVTDCTF